MSRLLLIFAFAVVGAPLIVGEVQRQTAKPPLSGTVVDGRPAPGICDPPPGQSYCAMPRTLTIRTGSGDKTVTVTEAVWDACGYQARYPACAHRSRP
jgi:hypothetical protein